MHRRLLGIAAMALLVAVAGCGSQGTATSTKGTVDVQGTTSTAPVVTTTTTGNVEKLRDFLAKADEAKAIINFEEHGTAVQVLVLKGTIEVVTLPEYDPEFTEAKVALMLALDYFSSADEEAVKRVPDPAVADYWNNMEVATKRADVRGAVFDQAKEALETAQPALEAMRAKAK